MAFSNTVSLASAASLLVLIWACSIIHQVHSGRTDAGRQLLFAKGNGIGFLELGTNVTSKFPASLRADGVSFDAHSGHVYWAAHECTNGTGGIFRANTDGSELTTVISTEALGNL